MRVRRLIPMMGRASAFVPTDIAGLQLWLKADSISGADGDPVTTWADQSGNGNDAAQAVADNKPTLKTNIKNGKPVVRFDGSNDVMAFTEIALTDFTVYLAYHPTDLSAGAAYVLGGANQGFIAGGAVMTGWGVYDTANLREAYNEPNTFGIAVAQNAALLRNGLAVPYNTTGTLTGLTISKIGQRGDEASLDFGGDIGEILIYNTIHNAATRAQVEAYLSTRWAVPVYVSGVDGTYDDTGPGVVLTFDDARSNLLDGFRYAQARGMKATVYAISDLIGGAGKLTSAQLVILDAASWDIGNHTKDHTDLTTLTEAQQETELSACDTALTGWGLSRGNKHVAYPYGANNADTATAMAATGMLTGRLAVTDAAGVDPATVTHYQINPTFYAANTDTLAAVQAAINTAIGAGKYCVILVHGLAYTGAAADEWPMSVFEPLLDWISAQGISMLSISDLYALM